MLHHRTKMTKKNIEWKTRRKMEMLELRDGYTYTSIEAHTVHAVSRSSGEISSICQATFSRFQYVPPLESIQHQNTSLMGVQVSRNLANTTSKRIISDWESWSEGVWHACLFHGLDWTSSRHLPRQACHLPSVLDLSQSQLADTNQQPNLPHTVSIWNRSDLIHLCR